MKLKFLLSAMVLATVTSLSAQQYSEDYVIHKNAVDKDHQTQMIYGVMAGVSIPVMSDKQSVVDISNTAGYEIGMMWGVDLGGINIVPEIWYQHDKTDLKNNSNGVEGELVSHSIEVPILFGVEFGPMRFNFGPSFSLMSNSKILVAGEEEADFGRVKSTAGYLFGLSAVLMEHLILDFRYTGRFVSTSNAWYEGYDGTEHDYRYYSFGVNLGYKF